MRALSLLAAALLLGPDAVPAQAPSGSWGLVASLGGGTVRDGRDWSSGGMEVGLGLEVLGEAWRGRVAASLRGVGVGCSHACVDGGWGASVGLSRRLLGLHPGMGVAYSDQFGEWQAHPFVGLASEWRALIAELRAEFPREAGGAYVPLVLSLRIP